MMARDLWRMNRDFSKASEAVVRNGPAHQDTLSLHRLLRRRHAYHDASRSVHTHARMHTRMHVHTRTQHMPPLYVLSVVPGAHCSVLFLQLHPAAPRPKSDRLGILTLCEEQMSPAIKSTFFFRPRVRKAFVMIGLSLSVLLKMHA